MKRSVTIPFFLMTRSLRSGNKWTLGLTVFLIAVAFVNLIFVAALFNGIITGSNEQIIRTITGDVFLTPPDGQEVFTDASTLVQSVRAVPGVAAVSAELAVPGNLRYQNVKGSWSILAVQPSAQAQVTNLCNSIARGSCLTDDDSDGILLGRQLAGGEGVELDSFSLHGAEIGATVELLVGPNVVKTFTVRGIVDSKFMNADQRAFITKAGVASFQPTLANQATTVIVRAAEGTTAEQLRDQLAGADIAATVHLWEDAAGLMKSVTGSFMSINVLLSTVAILIAAVTIFIVIYIDISNKRQQIGILRAIGISPHVIRAQYVLQSALYAIVGVAVGLGIFYAVLVPYFHAHPFVLPIGDMVLVPDPADFSIRVGSIIAVAIASGLIPAFIVTRLKLLSAIWGSK
jgi:putative ABC transport system permease protein